MKKFSLIVLTVGAVILAGCQAQPKPDEIVMLATTGWKSDNVGVTQVDTSLSYFSDDAVFKMVGFPPQIPAEFIGKEAIRAAFESWIPLHPKLQVEVIKVEGNTVTAKTQYWSDPTRAMGIAPLVGTDVYIVENGKIVSETWTLEDESQANFAVAFAPAAQAPATPLPPSTLTFPIGNYRNTVIAWTWDFKSDGSYSAGGPQVLENGIFTVNGSQISIKGSYCGNVTGIYTWTYDGTALKFEAINDECTERTGTIVSGKWVKRP